MPLINMNTCPVLNAERIKSCLIGEKYMAEIADLKALEVDCITIPRGNNLDEEIAFHADINAFNCGNKILIINESVAGELGTITGYDVVTCSGVKSPYPWDIKLNCAFLGNKLIGNTKYLAEEIKVFCTENNIEIIHSNQGYTKCSLAIVNENAVITEDSGLASLLKNYQIDVLKIEKGYIYLSDTHYGFIGGASGKISANEMYFSGDLSKHPDFTRITAFLEKYNIQPIYNKNRKLNDFGGFIPL